MAQPVPDREDLRTLLQKGETSRSSQRWSTGTARYNLGNIGRSFNEPTLALLISTSDSRQEVFPRSAAGHPDAAGPLSLSFKERDRPRLWWTGAHDYVPTGEIMIDAETGRVDRTGIEFVDGNILARVDDDVCARREGRDLGARQCSTNTMSARGRASRTSSLRGGATRITGGSRPSRESNREIPSRSGQQPPDSIAPRRSDSAGRAH